MHKMDKQEMIHHLNRWMEAHDRLEARWDALGDAFGVSLVDMPLWDATWAVFENYTATLGELLGDYPGKDSWMKWFYSENDMGKKKHVSGYDDDIRSIETTEDLADLIIQKMERE